MLVSTKAQAQGESLFTVIPVAVARRLGLTAGMDLFWAEDGHGGYRVYSRGEQAQQIVEAHEEAVNEYRDVFRELAK